MPAQKKIPDQIIEVITGTADLAIDQEITIVEARIGHTKAGLIIVVLAITIDREVITVTEIEEEVEVIVFRTIESAITAANPDI